MMRILVMLLLLTRYGWCQPVFFPAGAEGLHLNSYDFKKNGRIVVSGPARNGVWPAAIKANGLQLLVAPAQDFRVLLSLWRVRAANRRSNGGVPRDIQRIHSHRPRIAACSGEVTESTRKPETCSRNSLTPCNCELPPQHQIPSSSRSALTSGVA